MGLELEPGEVVVSLGTSGTAFTIATSQSADVRAEVAGFADCTGRFLPLVCTLNAARVLSSTADLLGVDLSRFSDLALEAPADAGGLLLIPYLDGERTPNLPDANGTLLGLTRRTMTPAQPARRPRRAAPLAADLHGPGVAGARGWARYPGRRGTYCGRAGPQPRADA